MDKGSLNKKEPIKKNDLMKIKEAIWQNKRVTDSLKLVGKQVAMTLVAVLIVMIFLAVSGYSPDAVLIGMNRAITKDIAGSIRWAAPLMLAGVAVCIPFKAAVFNLGVDGQIYMGAIAASAVMLALPEEFGKWGLLAAFLAAMIGGALFALIAAAMKVYFNTDMIVSTLLLNFVAKLFTEYIAADALRDADAAIQMNASKMFPESMWLPRLAYFAPSSANVGIYIAIAITLITAFIFYKTTLGYEIKLVGTNPNFARYGGMNANRVILKTMALSGAVAGLIGVIEVSAVQHRLLAGFNPSFGFDGIVVSLLANNNPFGVIFTSLFFGVLKNGGSNMERLTEVPQVITQITMAIIIITVSSNIVVRKIKLRRRMKKDGSGSAV